MAKTQIQKRLSKYFDNDSGLLEVTAPEDKRMLEALLKYLPQFSNLSSEPVFIVSRSYQSDHISSKYLLYIKTDQELINISLGQALYKCFQAHKAGFLRSVEKRFCQVNTKIIGLLEKILSKVPQAQDFLEKLLDERFPHYMCSFASHLFYIKTLFQSSKVRYYAQIF